MGTAKSIAGSTWPLLVFALAIFGGGLGAMAAFASPATPEAITALAAAVLGVAGTHVGHVAGHELATKRSVDQVTNSLERYVQLHSQGELNDEEFTAFKKQLLGS
jgi:hypothetical protein